MLFTCHINRFLSGILLAFLAGMLLLQSMHTYAEDVDIVIIDPQIKELIELAYQLSTQRGSRANREMRKQAVDPLKKIAEQSREYENYGQAIYIYKELHKLYKQVYGEKNRKTLGMLKKQSYIYQLAGKSIEQIKVLEYLLKYYESSFGVGYIETQRTMKSLASAYRENKSYDKSAQMYERIVKFHKDKGWTKHHRYKHALKRLSDLYIHQGDYNRAAPYFTAANNIRPGQKLELSVMGMTKYYNYAQILQVTGRYAEAEDVYKQMMAFARTHPMPGQMSIDSLYAHMGSLYHQIGAYEKALDYKEKAYQGFAKVFGKNSVLTAYMMTNLAETYLVLHKYEKALSTMKVVELILGAQIKKKHSIYIDKNFAMPTLALAYSKVGQYKKAEEIFLDAMDELGKEYSPRHVLVTHARSNLAEVYYLQNRLSEAEKIGLETLSAAIINKTPLILAQVYFNLAKIRYKQGHKAEAIFYGKQGINELQSLRSGLVSTEPSLQESFVDSQQANYEMLAAWLIDAGRLSEAEQVLAMLKEEEYFNFIRRNDSSNPKTTRAQLSGLEQKQSQNLIKSSKRLIEYATRLAELEKIDPEIRSVQDEKAIKKYQRLLKIAEENFQQSMRLIRAEFSKDNQAKLISQLNSGEYQKLFLGLPKNTALVHILPLDNDLRIILRTKKLNVAKKIKVSREKFNQEVNHYKQLVKRPDKSQSSIFKSSKQLYDWIVAPIEKDLSQAGIQNVMFYKNGVLRYIPLSTLHNGKQFLVERYAITNYTAAARESFKNSKTQKWTVAGMGVSKQHEDFSPLRMVPFELDNIVKTSSQDQVGIFPGQVFMDEAFTRRQFRDSLTGAYNVSHVATHYKFMPGTESDSFLLMGDGSHLSLAALRRDNYDFKAIDLLTLSACETAVSDIASDGREVEGLATLVQKQGAKGVMATLWPVADCSTGIFMQQFYQNRSQGLNKAEALRKTQLAFLNKKLDMKAGFSSEKGCQSGAKNKSHYQHPYFWAPFVLMGNWN